MVLWVGVALLLVSFVEASTLPTVSNVASALAMETERPFTAAELCVMALQREKELRAQESSRASELLAQKDAEEADGDGTAHHGHERRVPVAGAQPRDVEEARNF